jgi:imidazolonepropionase
MLLTNVTLATMRDGYGLIENGAVRLEGDRIGWVGAAVSEREAIDCKGKVLTPGLIDCHTHLVYGGNRAHEFEMRLEGVSYSDIAKAGGGILATVRATRTASEEELFSAAEQRLECLLGEGVTTLEIKSGYGLDVETEMKMLRVARRLGREREVTVVTSYLGAHATPPDDSIPAVSDAISTGFDTEKRASTTADSAAKAGAVISKVISPEARRAAYVDLICDAALPAVAQARLADAVDGFCEGIAFSPAEIERVFRVAQRYGLPVKLHAEQLSNLGGAKLAARYNALSVDHIEYLDQEGVDAISRSGTVAVLLPGAFYYLREKQVPPVDQLRRAGVPMALATDLNPGSSPVHSLLATLNMGCVLFGLRPEEALLGVTAHAARALGLRDRGMIAPGQKADLALWDVRRPGELCYPLGLNPLRAVIRDGRLVRGSLP